MLPKCDMEMGAVEFTCIANVAFLTLITIVGVPVMTNQWATEAIVIEFLLLTSAVMFNIIVLTAAKQGHGNATTGMMHLLDILKELEQKLRCSVLLLYKMILEGYNGVSSYILRYIHFFENSSLKLSRYPSSYKSEVLAKVSQTDVQTPETCAIKTKDLTSLKANSEPMKPSTAVNKTTQKGHFLNIKEKYLPLRSPELFKNKIYLTRRTLINSNTNNG